MSKDPSELIRAFCTRVSAGAKQKAQELAADDEAAALNVYQECHLIYQVDGEDRSMFGSQPPSLCRSQQWQDMDETAAGYFNDIFNNVTPLFKAIQSMGSAAMLAAR